MCNSSTAANHSRCLVMSHNALRDGNNKKKGCKGDYRKCEAAE